METKICTKCKNVLPLEKFALNKAKKDGRQQHCKNCKKEFDRLNHIQNREAQLERNRKNREKRQNFVLNYLVDHPCVICGESDPIVLDFDHIERASKTNNICDMVRNVRSEKSIIEEIQKCQVLCANCHRRKTAKEAGHYRHVNQHGPLP